MFNRGLSLDQAPPIDVVLRFFLTIAIFGVFAGVAMLTTDEGSVGIWEAPQTVAVVHLVLLGMVGMAMVGALFQMLPVMAGAPIRSPRYHARWIHALMGLGTLILSGAFYIPLPAMLHPAMAMLVGSLGFVVFLIFTKLLEVENKTASVKGMMAAVGALGIGLLFAVFTSLAFLGVDFGFGIETLRSIHLHFMLFGWIFILIASVAFQVVEMFYVTPPYPDTMRNLLPAGMLASLVLQIPVSVLWPKVAGLIDAVIAVLLLLFAIVSLMRFARRKRPVADATIKFWYTGLLSLVGASVLFFIYKLTGLSSLFSMAALLFAAFVLSIIFAMTYKIIPFLVWFHLNSKGVMETPMMGDVVPMRRASIHLWIHWVFVAVALASVYWPFAWMVAGAILTIESLWYGYNLVVATRIYYNLKDKGMF